eukprot:scaffold135145_cov69-Phaeocystis_antarctica.AAC.2
MWAETQMPTARCAMSPLPAPMRSRTHHSRPAAVTNDGPLCKTLTRRCKSGLRGSGSRAGAAPPTWPG